jgi:hypothetical protein
MPKVNAMLQSLFMAPTVSLDTLREREENYDQSLDTINARR